MFSFAKELGAIRDSLDSLHVYSAHFQTAKDFIKYIGDIGRKFQFFPEIMLMGHFDNAFTDIVEEQYPGLEKGCKIRVISHGFNKRDKDNQNRRSLEALVDLGIEVKVNVDAHARMFIGYHRETPKISEILLGSFDFNRDGLSRRKLNAGIWSRNVDLIQEAVTFFESTWEKKRSVSLEDYIK